MSNYSILNQIIVFLFVDVILGFIIYMIYVIVGSVYHSIKGDEWNPKPYRYHYRRY